MRSSSLRQNPLVFPLMTVLLAVGCGSSDDQGNMQASSPLDYHQDAKAILDNYCTNCHQSGGIAPFSLTDYASAKNYAPMIQGAVQSGQMPPWLPADDSLPVRYSREMRPEDKQTLLNWISDGALEGDPSAASRVTIPPVQLPAPARPDLTLDMGTPYQPNSMLTDDYRCFIIDPAGAAGGGLANDSYLQAGDIVPGTAAIVHHVLVFEIPQDQVATIKAKDMQDGKPGYSCFGGAGTDSAQLVTGWAPGGTTTRLDPDESMTLHKGSIFVMQVHYNLTNFNGQSDRTVAHMEFASGPTPYTVLLIPIANPKGLTIAAGDANASQTILIPVSLVLQALKLPDQSLTIISNAPHMHLLGTQITTAIDSQMLVDIPDWNFHWQQSYFFQQPVVAQSNQNIIVECHFDNSDAHQPIVNGVMQKPRDVTWGEDTLDEMCLSFLGIRFAAPSP